MMVFSKEYTMPSRAARLTAVCAAAPPMVTTHGSCRKSSGRTTAASKGCVEWTPSAEINFNHRRVLNDDGLFQRIHNAEPGRAIDSGLRGGAPHGNYPRLVQEEFGADHGGVERQSVIRRESVAQRDAERAIHAGEIAESSENADRKSVV